MFVWSSSQLPVSNGGVLHILSGIGFSVFNEYGQSNQGYQNILIKNLNEEICQGTFMIFLKYFFLASFLFNFFCGV